MLNPSRATSFDHAPETGVESSINSSGAHPPEARIELAHVWRLLVSGEAAIIETHAMGDRSFAKLRIGTPRSPVRRSPASHCSLVGRVLTGEAGKAVAADLNISLSTLSGRCSTTLAAIGGSRLVSRLSPLVAMAALAHGGVPLDDARLERTSCERWIVSVLTPAYHLRGRLSKSEYEVTRDTLEGKTHGAIAHARGTSERTIANQLASVFRKLNVSGRCELRALAIREAASAQRERPRDGEDLTLLR